MSFNHGRMKVSLPTENETCKTGHSSTLRYNNNFLVITITMNKITNTKIVYKRKSTTVRSKKKKGSKTYFMLSQVEPLSLRSIYFLPLYFFISVICICFFFFFFFCASLCCSTVCTRLWENGYAKMCHSLTDVPGSHSIPFVVAPASAATIHNHFVVHIFIRKDFNRRLIEK